MVQQPAHTQAVLDLGCGPSVLGIAAVLMGAGSVTGVDIDDAALAVARKNVEGFEDLHINFIQSDVAALRLRKARFGDAPAAKDSADAPRLAQWALLFTDRF